MPGSSKDKWQAWPAESIDLSIDQLISQYEQGFQGAIKDPEADEMFDAMSEYKTFSDAADAFGLADSGKGKLSLPFLSTMKYYPLAFPGPAQTTGDCVSRATATGTTVTIFVEVDLGIPDEETGKVEGPPELFHKDGNQGVIATEPIYGDRGHGGQGASCSKLAATVVRDGVLVRINYSDLGLDLSNYKASIGASWGGRGVPANVIAEGRKHLIRHSTRIKTLEEARDALANGYGLSCCSGLGFSSTRNEDGVSPRKGSWSHGMGWSAVDDRDWAHKKYGGPLFLIQNSWAKWNSGPRTVYGTNFQIPEGAFWVTYKDALSILNSDGSFAFSSANGWPRRELPDYGSHMFP